MSRPRNINVFQWIWECFFLRHVELKSRFNVMTTDEVTLDRLEVGTGFSAVALERTCETDDEGLNRRNREMEPETETCKTVVVKHIR